MSAPLEVALAVLAVQGTLGAADTFYYHEYVYALAAHPELARSELRLHAARDFLYAALYAVLPFVGFHGAFAFALGATFFAEIGITLADFVTEDRVRLPWGGVAPGERSAHALIGILYGGFLALFAPRLIAWASEPTALVLHAESAAWQRAAFPIMAAGALVMGVRDALASFGTPRLAFSFFPKSPRPPT